MREISSPNNKRPKDKAPWTREATLELRELVKESTLDELAAKLNCKVSRLIEKCRKHSFKYTRSKGEL
jgi:SH3-like domain-containing protein